MYVDEILWAEVVKKLNTEGIRTHLRKADHCSGNILNPLKQDICLRIPMYNYN